MTHRHSLRRRIFVSTLKYQHTNTDKRPPTVGEYRQLHYLILVELRPGCGSGDEGCEEQWIKDGSIHSAWDNVGSSLVICIFAASYCL